MKLELKHLAPYLPYGLKVLRPDNKTILEIKGVNGSLIIFERNGTLSQYGDLSNCKPILRNLSDLTKDIEVGGERFVPIVEIAKIRPTGYEWKCYDDEDGVMLGSYDDTVRSIKAATLEQYLKLFEYHFDVFGLIEQGLAIDINTIK